MSFSPSWLDLREPADHAARDPSLLADARRLAGKLGQIVDLGAGTGSTIRAMRTKPPVRWLLIDNDQTLLDQARRRHGDAIESATCDLSVIDVLPLPDVALITASALLDLAGAAWLDALADRLSARRLPIYAALNYDGRMAWRPADAEDDAVTNAFNRDQHTDKGLGGPALGPDGSKYLAGLLASRGYDVRIASSPWRLGDAQVDLQRALLPGIADAALRGGHPGAPSWLTRRLDRIGDASCVIGHVDLLAVPR